MQFAKLQFRSDFDTPQPMTNFFTGAKNVLIMLPAGYQESVEAGKALRKFRDQLTHLHLTVIHTSTWATALTEFPHCTVIRMDPKDINKFSLPSKSLMKRIFTKEYDVALDFNLDFVLHTAYICKASRARVRVNFFQHQASDIFYNVQFHLHEQKNPQALYEHCAKCLAMF
jgi:hypothetical protein